MENKNSSQARFIEQLKDDLTVCKETETGLREGLLRASVV